MIFKDGKSVLKEIKSGNISPVYLLHGEESFHIDEVTDYIENHLLSESEKAFNQQIIYGKDMHIDNVIDYAMQFPMMAERRVLIVKEAQTMETKGKNGDSEKFISYIKNPAQTTVLVLAHKNKKADGRSKWFKAIKDHQVILESNRIKDYQVMPWIRNYLKDHGFDIDNNALELVSEYLGSDLSTVTNELDKLKVNLSAGQKISLKEIESNIGISKDYNVFELQDALITKNAKKLGRIVANFQANMKKQPMELIVGSLFSFYQRLFIIHQNLKESDSFLAQNAGVNPYFLKKLRPQAKMLSTRGFHYAFKILSDYDGRTKGFGNRSASREELLKEMVGKLMVIK